MSLTFAQSARARRRATTTASVTLAELVRVRGKVLHNDVWRAGTCNHPNMDATCTGCLTNYFPANNCTQYCLASTTCNNHGLLTTLSCPRLTLCALCSVQVLARRKARAPARRVTLAPIASSAQRTVRAHVPACLAQCAVLSLRLQLSDLRL